jgi:hypothetical protein
MVVTVPGIGGLFAIISGLTWGDGEHDLTMWILGNNSDLIKKMALIMPGIGGWLP